MADFQTDSRRANRGSPNRNKIRVDLTPMVDLAFLLITFFMLTTVLTKPTVMPIVMPEKHNVNLPEVALKESQVLTLLLGDSNRVYYYEGISAPTLDSTNYDSQGIRRVILDKKRRVDTQWSLSERPDPKNPGFTKLVSKMTVLIKPTSKARYKNVVDALDEMQICGVAHYVLMDISTQELAFIDNPNPEDKLNYSRQPQLDAASH